MQLGVDNLRHDVHLSPQFVEQARLQIARLIVRHGDMDGLLAAETRSEAARQSLHRIDCAFKTARAQSGSVRNSRPLLADLHVSALNRAKAAENLSVDVLARAAIIKFLRVELNSQFAQLLERGRMMLKSYEGVRQQKALEYRERVANLPGGQKNHPAQDRTGTVPHLARD